MIVNYKSMLKKYMLKFGTSGDITYIGIIDYPYNELECFN